MSADEEDEDDPSVEALRARFADFLDHLHSFPSRWSTAYRHYRLVDLTLEIAIAHGLVVNYYNHSVKKSQPVRNGQLSLAELVEELAIDKWMSFKNKLTLYFRVHKLMYLCDAAIGRGEADEWSEKLERYRHLFEHWVTMEPSGDEWWTKGKLNGDDTRAELKVLINEMDIYT